MENLPDANSEERDERNEIKDLKKDSFCMFLSIIGVLVVYMISSSAYSPLTDQYAYSFLARKYGLPCGENDTLRACVRPQSQCRNDNSSDPLSDLREKVEQESSIWVLYFTVPKAIITFVTSLLYGSYSDRAGRKIPIILPCIGLLINYLILGFVIFFQLDLYFIAIACAIEALFGSIGTHLLGVFAYASDVSPLKVLTFRIAVLEGLMGVALSLTSLGLGYLIKDAGFFYPVIVSAALLLVDILGICFIKETIQRTEDARFFSCQNFQKIFQLFTVDNNNSRLWKIRLLMLSTLILGLPCIAFLDVQTLYQLDSPLCWTSVKIGFFLFGRYSASLFVQLILSKVFSHWFDDDLMALIVMCMGIASWTFEAFATTDLMMYLVIAIGMSFDPFTFIRAMASKLGDKDEQGAILSAVAGMESLAYMAGQVAFTNLYRATLGIFQGMVFLAMAAFYVIALIPFLIYVVRIRREKKYQLLAQHEATAAPSSGEIDGGDPLAIN